MMPSTQGSADQEDVWPAGGRSVHGTELGVGASLILVDEPPGGGPSLHYHEYAEVFVVHEGEATMTIGGESTVATVGHIAVAHPGQRHKFTNNGAGRLRMTDIHLSPRIVTTWVSE